MGGVGEDEEEELGDEKEGVGWNEGGCMCVVLPNQVEKGGMRGKEVRQGLHG